MPHVRVRLVASLIATVALAAASAGIADAHAQQTVGPYRLEIGWRSEPAYVGQPNAVQVTIRDAQDQPVNDLAVDDLKVVLSTGSQQSDSLAFEPAFDLEGGDGPFGEYDAAVVPTAPGDYTFHLTGSIHGHAVDLTLASSETTFNTVQGTSDIEFPAKLPTMAEVATRLDRVDARIAAVQTSGGPTQADVDAARASAADARSAADRALLVGGGLGLIGLAVGAAAIAMQLRGRRPSAG